MDGRSQWMQAKTENVSGALGRRTLMAGGGVSAFALGAGGEAASVSEGEFTGPLVGHVDTRSARVWLRPGEKLQKVRSWTCEVKRGSEVVTRA